MSRRSGRYERRKAKREANRLQRSLDVGGLKEVFTFHDLYKAGKQCCNAVRWKNSTQKFELHMFSGTARLGVEPSQAEMIAFPSALDNYIKCQLSIQCAGHYMDDYYIIVPPDRDPKEIMNLVVAKAETLRLTISRSKSRIVPLTKPFRYCKAKYRLTETGKVVVNGNRDGVKRARKKIKAFYHKIQNNEMSYEDLWTSVNGMLAYFESYNDHKRVLRLRRLFYAIFGFSPERIENFRERGIKGEIHCS